MKLSSPKTVVLKTFEVLSVSMTCKCKTLSVQWIFYQSKNIRVTRFHEYIVSHSDWHYQIIVSPACLLSVSEWLTDIFNLTEKTILIILCPWMEVHIFWLMGISTVSQTQLTVPLHSLNSRQILPLVLCKGMWRVYIETSGKRLTLGVPCGEGLLRLLHGHDCFTVPNLCTYTHLGSQGYFGI